MRGSAAACSTELADLVARVRSGDAAAWGPLLGRFEGRLRLYVRYRLGRALAQRVDVDDVLQETWLRALRAVPQFRAQRDGGGGAEGDGESALYRLLAALARRAIVDAARAARAQRRDDGAVRRLALSEWSREGAAARTAGPVTRAERAERDALLDRAFVSLTPAERRVIALRQFEQLPAKDVAVRLGTTAGAVHAAYRRALLAWGAAFRRCGGTSSH